MALLGRACGLRSPLLPYSRGVSSLRCLMRELTLPQEPESKPRVSISGHDLRPLTQSQKRKAEDRLHKKQRDVLLHKKPEQAHGGMTANGFKFDTRLSGTYVCGLGGLPVFHSSQKVDMGLGYATFTAAVDEEHVDEKLIMMGLPYSERGAGEAAFQYVMQPSTQQPGMVYIEVTDRRAGAHLGYAFKIEGKKVFCVNAAGLYFVPDGTEIPTKAWRFLINDEFSPVPHGAVSEEKEDPKSWRTPEHSVVQTNKMVLL